MVTKIGEAQARTEASVAALSQDLQRLAKHRDALLAALRNGREQQQLTYGTDRPMAAKLTRTQYHYLYHYLLLNRRVDEQLTHLYRQGKVVGGVYSSLGQEAISVGTAYALGPDDFLGGMIRNV